MGRYFLDRLANYSPTTSLTKTSPGERDPREDVWEQEREKYGFDSRETWSMYTSMTELLYERLQRFLENADPVIVIRDDMRKAIERMIYLAEVVLLDENEDEVETVKASHELWLLWAEHHQKMWW